MQLSQIRSEIEHMRRQIHRQRKDIQALLRTEICTVSAEELLARMLTRVDELAAERDRLVAALQPLVHQHHSRPVPDQNLHTVSPFRAEHKGRPTERIKLEHLLHQRRKSS